MIKPALRTYAKRAHVTSAVEPMSIIACVESCFRMAKDHLSYAGKIDDTANARARTYSLSTKLQGVNVGFAGSFSASAKVFSALSK